MTINTKQRNQPSKEVEHYADRESQGPTKIVTPFPPKTNPRRSSGQPGVVSLGKMHNDHNAKETLTCVALSIQPPERCRCAKAHPFPCSQPNLFTGSPRVATGKGLIYPVKPPTPSVVPPTTQGRGTQ
ncbi:hypothetical protein GOBAR_AA38373 [Gossypium barbadense]|uniref:Uncharacterized protein n=1 Tax=Gossypium barbadense TaxID=3634 RepID=A0A2P5VU21_GOSBA|nr:hypothetical protein GOBAR_AA38373 [Gossypium barbadense]